MFDPSNIVVENHSKRAGLQIADAVTSAYFLAVEPNYYGTTQLSMRIHCAHWRLPYDLVVMLLMLA